MAETGLARIRRLARRMLDGGGAPIPAHLELRRASTAQSYRQLLARVGPAGVHEGFYQEDLDLILRK